MQSMGLHVRWFGSTAILLLLVFLFQGIYTAQTSQEGETLISEEGETLIYVDFGARGGFIAVASASGSRYIELPEDLYEGLYSGEFDTFVTNGASLSLDGTRLAVGTRYDQMPSILPIRIASLDQNSCCWYIDLPPGTVAYELAGFDPSGTRLAISYVTGEEPPFSGGIMVVPVPFIEDSVPIFLEMASVTEQFPELPDGVWARMGDWHEDGIRFYPNCYACDGAFEGEYAIWNPDTGQIIPHSGEFFSSFGTQLAETGEAVLATYDSAYPGLPQEGPFPPSNVIRYSPTGNPLGPDSYIIYHNQDVDLSQIDWVLDGQAILVLQRGIPTWMLIYRDGTVRPVDYIFGNNYLMGTPQGWLVTSGDGDGITRLVHYDASGETPGQQTDWGFSGGWNLNILRNPIGAGLPQPPPPFQMWPFE